MYFLTGEYDHQIDAKNRIRIPSKLRGNEDKLYFAKGMDGCIYVFYESKARDIVAELEENVKLSDRENQKGLRMFTKSIKPVEVDPQGRFVIPPELVAAAKIVKDVKICGAGSRIEIWSKESYDAYYGEDEGDFDEKFSHLGI